MDTTVVQVIKQHLIDPEICIRCNTCEATCPVGAITHDDRNYVVDVDKCNLCMDCISPCPTGSIDNWRQVPRVKAYSVGEQLSWDELPAELGADALADAGVAADAVVADTQAAPSLAAAAQRRDDLPRRPVRRHAAALVGGAPVHQPVRARRRPTRRSRPR